MEFNVIWIVKLITVMEKDHIQLNTSDNEPLCINNVMLIVMSFVAIQDVVPLRMVLGIVLTILKRTKVLLTNT